MCIPLSVYSHVCMGSNNGNIQTLTSNITDVCVFHPPCTHSHTHKIGEVRNVVDARDAVGVQVQLLQLAQLAQALDLAHLPKPNQVGTVKMRSKRAMCEQCTPACVSDGTWRTCHTRKKPYALFKAMHSTPAGH